MTSCLNGTYYQVKVQGVLDQHWSERFGGFEVSSSSGETTIAGNIIDQSALHGLLMQIRDLGLPLLLVQQIGTVSTTQEEQSHQEKHQEKEENNMSEPFHLEPPKHMINCVIGNQETADALVASLADAGYSGEGSVSVLHGEADLQRIDPDGSHHGGFARFMRAFQKFTTGVDERILNAAEEALKSGKYMVGVFTDGSETQRDEVHRVMQEHGGTRIFFAGHATTQLLSGW